MSDPASVVVFDVNETLSDMRPMAERFTEIGAPAHQAQLWFATLLRDGFALTAVGTRESFSILGEAGLRIMLAGTRLNRDIEEAVTYVMEGFLELPLHPDVPDGVRALRAAGLRLVTLTNGSSAVAESLLSAAHIRDQFEMLLSVEQAGVWKPARGAYEYCAHTCETDLNDMLLVAVHPWDIDGAARAGMQTAWINRRNEPYPTYFTQPLRTVESVRELADQIAG